MNRKLLYSSSYDRGLDNLLINWDTIIKNYPDAELHVCYGWDLFDIGNHHNPERMAWKKNVEGMMQKPGIVHHGRVGKGELAKIRKQCTFWVYPTYFTEINCISAIEAQASGLVPVTVPLAALDETVQSGVKVTADISKPEGMQQFLIELFSLFDNPERVKEEQKKARKHAENYKIEKIADKWGKVFRTPLETPLITIYTPTIRKGWFNIMAHALARQTYKNFEWIIIDDLGIDRTALSKKYADKYKLDIRYIKGDKFKVTEHALVRANNTALREAKGELLVFLQDFILPPDDGFEKMVNIYKKHPKDLIAPVDTAFLPTVKPDLESEDWFNGATDIEGETVYKNVRLKMRTTATSNHYHFEQNYGAIPVSVARELNGWYEFMDDGLGYDNAEIAYRAIKLGSLIQIDVTNVARCLHHGIILKDYEVKLSVNRAVNEPRFIWLEEQIEAGNIPIVRDIALDNRIVAPVEIPEGVEPVEYLQKNMDRIISHFYVDKQK